MKTYTTIQSPAKQAQMGDQSAANNVKDLSSNFNQVLVGQLSQVNEAIAQGSKALHMVNENSQMSPADKRQLMDTITFQMMGAAERGNKIFNSSKH
jgi:hypothetical protein